VVTNGRAPAHVAHAEASGGVAAGLAECGARTYTDPENFTATSPIEINLQAGMVDGEGGAVSFPVDPSLFPIRFESAECLFAQSHSNATLTQWSMTLWDGPPVAGQGQGLEVITIESNGIDVPHVIMPGANGARATNLSIVVDPEDPEPIFLFNDSGRNMISVSFKIVRHNSPSPLPCFLPPDPGSNAFMTTDTDSDSASSPTNNWLTAITCENACDGTNRFSQLPEICQPTGDWIMRLTFACTQIGACCDVDAVCADSVSDRDCADQRGTFMGGDSACAAVECPAPDGACCFSGECLENVQELLCNGFSTGFYMGNGAICSEVDCTRGACCFPEGNCQDMVDVQCEDAGGNFQGGATCATFQCPQPRGACCIEGACVFDQPRNTCLNVGGTFVGIGATCTPDPCSCPITTILTADPPSGTVDARQPHAVGAAIPRWGIGSADEPIHLTLGASGASADCFTLCETSLDPLAGANDIASVEDLGGGNYVITLMHAITPGAITELRYTNDPTPVTYMSHPANVNNDTAAGPADILYLIDVLNGVSAAPFGLYSVDVDRSGQPGPPDILRLIDLLNGAGTFDSWLNTARPANGGCP
jgi:hypothetical protein